LSGLDHSASTGTVARGRSVVREFGGGRHSVLMGGEQETGSKMVTC